MAKRLAGVDRSGSRGSRGRVQERAALVGLIAGRAPGGAPSTIIAFDVDGPVLVRAGAIAWERVIKSLQ